jgi:hypothetical protein
MNIKEKWEEYFEAPYPEVIRYSVGADMVNITIPEFEEFVKELKLEDKPWREINLYAELVATLIRVYKWCLDTGRNEFKRSEIKEVLLRGENDTARFGDWILFGAGMVYKPKGKGYWGLNMERVDGFLKGEKEIPVRIAKRGKEVKVLERGTIKDIKNLSNFLSEDMKFMVKYLNTEDLFKF